MSGFKWINIGDETGVWVGAHERGEITAGIAHYPDQDFKYRYSVAAADPLRPLEPSETFIQGTRPSLELCMEAAEIAASQYFKNGGQVDA